MKKSLDHVSIVWNSFYFSEIFDKLFVYSLSHKSVCPFFVCLFVCFLFFAFNISFVYFGTIVPLFIDPLFYNEKAIFIREVSSVEEDNLVVVYSVLLKSVLIRGMVFGLKCPYMRGTTVIQDSCMNGNDQGYYIIRVNQCKLLFLNEDT